VNRSVRQDCQFEGDALWDAEPVRLRAGVICSGVYML